MSASAVRMGRAFVEIGADATKLFNAINKANARMGRFAAGMRSVGANVMAMGTALAAPIVAAAATGSRFEDVLLNMRAATNMTADEMKTVRAAALSMSEALGVGPTEAANGFLELVKAGVPLETVLTGAGQAAVQFATVGQMAVADAAVVMADAMKVFGVTGNVAADTLSSAADASSTSIEGIAQAFTQVSAVAGLANQSIQDTAAALAILANNGVKGSDAGTSLKTMLLRLMAPTDEAAQSLARIGLSVDSFRGADGKVKPLADVIGTLNAAMAGMDQVARDQVFSKIFGQDAIRAAAILTTAGVDGFGAMRQSMTESLGVGNKFGELMSGISGTAARLFAALQRVAIAITEALGPSLISIGSNLTAVLNGLTKFVSNNGEVIVSVAKGIAVFAGAGAALYVLGAAINAVSSAIGFVVPLLGSIVTTTIAVAGSLVVLIMKMAAFKVASVAAAAATAVAWAAVNLPFIYVAAAAAVLGTALFAVLDGVGLVRSVTSGLIGTLTEASKSFLTMKDIGVMAFGEILASIKAGDVAGAMQVAMEGLKAAFTVGSSAFLNMVDEWGVNLLNAFDFYISQIPFLRFATNKYQFSLFGDSTGGADTPDSRADARFAEMNQRQSGRLAASRDAMAGFSTLVANRSGTRLFEAANATQAAQSTATAAAFAANLASVRPGSFDADLAALGAGQPGQFEKFMADMQAGDQRQRDLLAQQSRMREEAASQAEVAGTFSAAAASGMGFGSSLQQKMVDHLKNIDEHTGKEANVQA